MNSTARIRAVVLCAALLFISGRAVADTIVLKNGRRITALSVFEEGNKVRYLTSAGELSLPKSIVDHIEKGGAVPMAGGPGADAANLAIAPPSEQPAGGSGETDAIERTSQNLRAMRTEAQGKPILMPRWAIMRRPRLN
jgi:hypothetical protein